MKSLVSVEVKGDEVIVSFALKLLVKGSEKRLPGMTTDESFSHEDLVSVHEKYGLTVFLAYLRSWLWKHEVLKLRRKKK